MMAAITNDEQAALKEVMQMLETTPDSPAPSAEPIPFLNDSASNDTSNQREKLAVLMSTGKSKEAIGVQLTHKQIKRLTDKEVAKFYKRHEAYVGNKTTETLIDSFLMLVSKGVGMFVAIDDVKELQKDLKKRLHHQPRISLRCWQPFTAMWSVASGSQYCSYHNKTHRTN